MRIQQRIAKIRKRIGMAVIGEQEAMIIPNRLKPTYDTGAWDNLPDPVLASLTRFYFAIIRKVNIEGAEKRDIPLSVFTTSQAVMSLVRAAVQANAGSMTITQNGKIAGIETGNWEMRLTKLPDGYEFGEPGSYQTMDGEKLVEAGWSFNLGKPLATTHAPMRGNSNGDEA